MKEEFDMNFQEIISKSEDRLFIIAEIGVNHNGSIETALKLVDAAVAAGCDAVKFQTWITERVYSKTYSIKPDYQIATTDPLKSEFETIKQLELSKNEIKLIKQYCDERKISFFSTPDEVESADLLKEIGVDLMKTASQDVTNTPFLEYVASLGVPVIYSTGACNLSELVLGYDAIKKHTNQIMVLHCVSSYPAPLEQMNLSFIDRLKKLFDCPIGFSDHTPDVYAACSALSFGARIFEKHITLSKSMEGPDHQASLEPAEMTHYCTTLRRLHAGLGDGVKRVMPCEENSRKAFRRYLTASRNLKKGEKIFQDDICFKKIVDGIPPQYYSLVVGSILKTDVAEDSPIHWNMFELL